MQLSNQISFGRGSVVKAFAVIQTSAGGRISFGDNCVVGNFNHISTGEGGIQVGDNVRFGPHVTVLGMNNVTQERHKLIVEQGYTSKGIVIGSDVLLGAGATILDGCTIGDGAVVGVGSIVQKDVAPYTIVLGSPAKAMLRRA